MKNISLAGFLAVCGALHIGADQIEAQGTKKPPKKTTTLEVPKVDVTASEGSTAAAIRGRPATPDARATSDSLAVAGLHFHVNPPASAALGQPVAMGVRPAMPATTYRYVATMVATGISAPAAGTACGTPKTIGKEPSVTWNPASGKYRLTVHSLTNLAGGTDSASVQYDVVVPTGGWLNMSVVQPPNPQPPGRFTLIMHTNDRGAGHLYEWSVRMTAPDAPVPPITWTGQTNVPSATAQPLVVPNEYNISARVGIHRGDACQILETSARALLGQVIR